MSTWVVKARYDPVSFPPVIRILTMYFYNNRTLILSIHGWTWNDEFLDDMFIVTINYVFILYSNIAVYV